ncbi:Fur family transcriptional regulator, zinc uptake regulator [Aliiroseovarius halocynthiae]|uniref:Transcriptional repressor n=1 Tax=Aliiroseovarius halocynthiae TaxID=985055 RepID=A0A545SSN5_9RHOB|nr:Fur family transcriptional regulator [Aliiroseovarius halocynthiae]TQV67946.1 transcriptional repressor [Aliiroseovarius halocynthiae]SMR73048.1 Fur family transcriptional regulator, zinc uptake regulator [Aliiroseovarius halocynthiae]
MPDLSSAFHSHDHSTCASAALTRAEEICREAGARLTPVRRRTLEILLEEHRAMGAYDVLERLAADGFGSQPPVAYRALEFLVDQGLAHRIRRLNAFAACTTFDCDHAPAFFICKACKAVAEIPASELRAQIDAAGASLGFAVERANVEAMGLCPSCQAEAAA